MKIILPRRVWLGIGKGIEPTGGRVRGVKPSRNNFARILGGVFDNLRFFITNKFFFEKDMQVRFPHWTLELLQQDPLPYGRGENEGLDTSQDGGVHSDE